MSIYQKVYDILCEQGKQKASSYTKYSGLHAHHIIPRHQGGTDEESNITYLTVREHILAHFMLWKIHRNPNDLRSMKMLGANLSIEYRRNIGIFCKENGIGWFSEKTRQRQKISASIVGKNAVDNGLGIHNPEKRSEYASLGGKAGGKSQMKSGLGIHNPEKRSEYASLGGKALKGYKAIHKGSTKKRVHHSKLQEYIEDGWVLGWPKS